MSPVHLLCVFMFVAVYGLPEAADKESPETEADVFFTSFSAPRVGDPWEVGAPWEEFKVEMDGKLAELQKRQSKHQESLDSLKAEVLLLSQKASSLSNNLAHLGKKNKTPVYFSVYRTSGYKQVRTTIPYENAWVNVGGAMDVKRGVFTAPYHGIYYFNFNVHMARGTVVLQVDGKERAAAGHTYLEDTSQGFSQMLELKRGSRVSVFIIGYYMYDDSNNPHYKGPYYGTQFTGMLLHSLE